MFEITIHDAANVNIFTEARNAGAEAADSTNQKLNGDTFLRGGVERLSDLRIHESVCFDKYSRGSARTMICGFAMDMFEEAWGKVEWGDEEFVEVGGLGHSRQDIEEGSDFGC
jgi:hypothetical protein